MEWPAHLPLVGGEGVIGDEQELNWEPKEI